MTKRVSRKPNKVLFGVGEHTTNLQNRIIVASLSYFRTHLTKEDLETLSPNEITDLTLKYSGEVHSIPLSLFAADMKPKEFHFQQSLKKQLQKLVSVHYAYFDEKMYGLRNIFQEVEYEYRSDYIYIRFTPVFLKDLFEMVLEGYTPIRLQHYLKLTQEYSGKLYYRVISSLNFGKKEAIIEYELDDLRQYLGIINNEGKYSKASYKEWYVFKRDVLIPAIEDINNNSDIHISYNTRRKGRSVFWITLTLTRQIVTEVIDTPEIENDEHRVLKSIGLTTEKAIDITNSYPDLEFLTFAVKRSKSRAKDNVAGYFLTAVEDMHELWQLQQAQKQMEAEKKKFEEERKRFEEEKWKEEQARKKAEEERRNREAEEKTDKATIIWNEMNEEERTERLRNKKRMLPKMPREMLEQVIVYDIAAERFGV